MLWNLLLLLYNIYSF